MPPNVGIGSIVEKVYAQIKNNILTGEFLPGTHLVEANLAAKFKVSRVTIRDAFRRLTYDELVDLKPNSGVWVRRLSYDEIVDLYAVREPLEILAARLTAEQPRERLQEIVDICSEGSKLVIELDRISHKSLNRRFHRAVAAVTGNQILIKLLERLNTQMIANQFMPVMKDEDIITSVRDHEKILAAALAGDCDQAEEIMRNHIRQGREFALASARAGSSRNEEFL